jgi:curved DNA-binding protein
MRDLYTVLGLQHSATHEEIRASFRELAVKYHPDKVGGDSSRAVELNQAYGVLGDEKKRALYDEFGEESLKLTFNEENVRLQKAYSGNTFFRTRSTSSFQKTNSAAVETVKEVLGEVLTGFMAAQGPGYADGLFKNLKTKVEGEKEAAQDSKTEESYFEVSISFKESLTGTLVLIPQDTDKVRVRIPSGVMDGERIRVRGLPLKVFIERHPDFVRSGLSLVTTLDVTLGELYHGSKTRLSHPDGTTVAVTIPPHSQNSDIVIVEGKGVQRGTKCGNLHVRLQVVLPVEDSPEIAAAIDLLSQHTDLNKKKVEK